MKSSLKLLMCISLLLLLAAITIFAQKPELIVQTGHTGPILLLALSPDGKTLAASSLELKLWDVTAGVELRTLSSIDVSAIVFSPNGKTLASGTGEGKVDLWDVTTGAKLHSLEVSKYRVESLAFSGDGQTIATGSQNTIKLWDSKTGTHLRSLEECLGCRVLSLAFSPEGKMLANGNTGGRLNLWEIPTGKQVRFYKGHVSDVNSVVFSPDGQTLVSSSSDRIVKLWDVTTGAELRTIASNSMEVSAITLSPEGKTFASSTRDGRVDLWEVSTGVKRRSFQGPKGIIFSMAFGPEGQMLATAGMAAEVKDKTFNTTGGGEVELWDASTGTRLRSLKRHASGVEAVAYSPDGKMLASACLDGTVKLWNISTGMQVRSFKGHADHTVIFTLSDYSVAFSPDSKMLASASIGEAVNLWDVSTGTQLHTLKGDDGGTLSIGFSPDGKTLAGSGADGGTGTGTVKLWDVSTGELLRSLKGHSRAATSVAFSPDGQTLASGDRDGTVKLWNISTGAQLSSLESGIGPIGFSSNGKMLASGSFDQTIKLWDVATGTHLRSLAGNSDRILAVAFSSDGQKLASMSNQTIKLWDVATSAQLSSLERQSNYFTSVAFSPDNKTFASGGMDGTIKIADTNSGEELASLISLDENEWAVVAPDGLFDGSPSALNKLIWRAPQNTFDYAPVEAYFSDFYYPGLLADSLTGKAPKAPKDISQKDRRLPHLQLTLSGQQTLTTPITTRRITVKIAVSNVTAGAQDVRLFRNGSLVRVWQGDLPNGKSGATLEATLPIVAGENRLTAYAFNRDNVKSVDATLVISGADSLRRKGTAYILAVGVNRYANPQYDLKYAVADAQDFSAEVRRQQEGLHRYEQTKVIALYDAEATKANILRGLARLASQIQPEDWVIIYFAGHGTAHGNQFYLLPHDLGYTGSRTRLDADGLRNILTHSISDRELTQAFEKMDAGQLLLVIDACNSGQALEAEEKRRGPMNSKGLAQLAYEKGMYILTAAQSYQAAQEAARFGHGFLTYALIEEGLKKNAADDDPKDAEVLVREWLNYATERVPKLQEELMLSALRGRGLNMAFVEGEEKIKGPKSRSVQQPRVFYRRELEAQPLIVSKTATTLPR
ncbi:MAG: caspase family protein [Pyrinomonadaceae bacterium]|nr:caspase family protein [Pyrinomonadaceae bacterium]